MGKSKFKKNDSKKFSAPGFFDPVFQLEIGAALQVGCLKYGEFNFLENEFKASRVISATQRHILEWYANRDYDDDTGLSHLAHATANLMMLYWSQRNGNLIDDRVPSHGDIQDIKDTMKKFFENIEKDALQNS